MQLMFAFESMIVKRFESADFRERKMDASVYYAEDSIVFLVHFMQNNKNAFVLIRKNVVFSVCKQ